MTGKGEEQFLPNFLRAVTAPGLEGSRCIFKVIRRVPQLHPISPGSRRDIKMTGRGMRLPTRDEELGHAALAFLKLNPSGFVMLVDDLEHNRRGIAGAVFERYRQALDGVLNEWRWRASVHFLVNMLEAYYFADPNALKEVLGLKIDDHDVDVESIRHPKNDIRSQFPGFNEIEHGNLIACRIDLEIVLDHPKRCTSLRSMIAWCSKALGRRDGHRFQLLEGLQWTVTSGQKDQLPAAE